MKTGLTAVIIFFVALIVYLLTLAPTVTLVDSGELITAAALPGVAHPPGFPLYVLTGHFFSMIPLENIAWRLNLMSAVFAAAAGAVLFLTVKRFFSHGGSFLPGPVASLGFAFSLTFWGYAVVTEVYTLNVFLTVLLIFLLLSRRENRAKNSPQSNSSSRRGLLIPAFLFGLALGNHHVTILLLVPAFIYLLISVEGWRFFISRQVLPVYLMVLLGMAVHLYLPLRASRDPLLNWGDPSSWGRFVGHLTGKQYHGEQFSLSSFSSLADQSVRFLRLWAGQFTPAGLVFVLLGLPALRKRDRRLFWFTVLMAGFSILYALNYQIASDREAYYLPVFLVSALWLGEGIGAVVSWASSRGKLIRITASILILLLPAFILLQNWSRCDRSRDFIAENYARDTLKGIEPGGLLLTREWQLYSPLLYLQLVEGVRPDTAVIDTSLLKRSWYFQYLRRQYPDLLEAAAPEVEAYRNQLELFEKGLPHDGNLIQRRFLAMIEAFIAGHLPAGPVYLTMPVEEGLRADYTWIPSGLAFRLWSGKDPPPPPEIELDLKGLNDATVPLTPEAKHVRSNYALMLVNYGTFWESREGPEAGLPYYLRALELDPGCRLARRLLARSDHYHPPVSRD